MSGEADQKARELLTAPLMHTYVLDGRQGDERQDLAKAAGDEVQRSNVIQSLDETERAFTLAGAIEPPYNPATLTALFEHSNSLRQNIDAYAANIDAPGHRFDPVIDLDGTEATERLAHAMRVERDRILSAIPDDPAYQQLAGEPTEAEVAIRATALRVQMREERSMLENFFDYCCEDMSFVRLRRQTRQDLEVMGNGYWEVLRNGLRKVSQFTYIPGFTIRLLPLDSTYTKVQTLRKTSDLDYESVEVQKRFRHYIQVYETRVVHFKEFGDSRVMSRKTGAIFQTVEELCAHDTDDGPATELLHFRIHNPRSAYGVPRWTGNLLSVLGSRQAEEVNYLYFENKSVPPLALLVSGGRVTQDTVNRLQDYIENEIKGKKNWHKILILEAEPAPGSPLENSGRMKIELRPLTAAQHNDALFLDYDERNMDKVGQAFRLPRLLRGDVRDFNRATADAALEFAETQVFAPEREDFDFMVNRKILPAIGARFHRFRSNAPSIRNPSDLATIIESLAPALTVDEQRQLAAGVFNREFKRLDADWTKQPMPLTLAEVAAGVRSSGAAEQSPEEGTSNEAATKDAGTVGTDDLAAGGALRSGQGRLRRLPPHGIADAVKALVAIRKGLLEEEAGAADRQLKADKTEGLETEVRQVPLEVMRSFFAEG